MLQGREIPMYATDECIAGIVALRERKQVANVDEAHGEGLGRYGCSAAVGHPNGSIDA